MEAQFRRPKSKKNLRATSSKKAAVLDSSSGEEEEDISNQIQDVREFQKGRQRRGGMDAVECAVGKELAKEFNKQDENPFQMRGGGMLKLSDNRKAALDAADIENDIKEQFKKETLLRDEHEEMRKYIETRLKKSEDSDSGTEAKRPRITTLEDEVLFKAAEKVKKYVSKPSEELLSNQMLVGIPEIDLGIEVRMSNIIETEQKKIQLLQRKNFFKGAETSKE